MPANYTDPQDYWTGAGYSEMGDTSNEGYRPFDESKALGRDFSTPDMGYAPWAGGPTTGWDSFEMDPYAGGTYPTGNTGGYEQLSNISDASKKAGYGGAAGMGAAAGAYGGLGFASGGIGGMAGLMSSGILGPAGLAGAGIGYMSQMIGKKKKRGTPGLEANEAYQGFQFEPAEGFPAYYETAQGAESPGALMQDEGFQYQAPQQQGYDYNYTGGVQQPSGQLADLNQQSYVGQQEQEYGSFYNRDKGGIFDTFTV